jgi:hypothetical protein
MDSSDFDYQVLTCIELAATTLAWQAHALNKSKIKNLKSSLSLRELEALARALLAILLALFNAWIAGDQACLF